MNRGGIRSRVILDCNVMVQALASPTGPATACLRLLEQNQIDLFASRATLNEFRAVMNYPSVRRKFIHIKDDEIAKFIEHLHVSCNIYPSSAAHL